MIGLQEIIVIGLIVLLLFGAAAIPKIARSLGKAKGEFEKGLKDGEEKISAPKNTKTKKTKKTGKK